MQKKPVTDWLERELLYAFAEQLFLATKLDENSEGKKGFIGT